MCMMRHTGASRIKASKHEKTNKYGKHNPRIHKRDQEKIMSVLVALSFSNVEEHYISLQGAPRTVEFCTAYLQAVSSRRHRRDASEFESVFSACVRIGRMFAFFARALSSSYTLSLSDCWLWIRARTLWLGCAKARKWRWSMCFWNNFSSFDSLFPSLEFMLTIEVSSPRWLCSGQGWLVPAGLPAVPVGRLWIVKLLKCPQIFASS